MKPAIAMFYVTAAVVFIQLVTGGLRVFGFIGVGTHIATGYLTLIVAIVTLVAAAATKPRFSPALVVSGLLVVLVIVQGILGFVFLKDSDRSVIVIHYVNALIIYGLAMSGVFVATRWNRKLSGLGW